MITNEVDSEEKEEAYLFQEVKGTKFETAEDDTRRFSPIRRSVFSFFLLPSGGFHAKGFLQCESGVDLMWYPKKTLCNKFVNLIFCEPRLVDVYRTAAQALQDNIKHYR